MPKPKYALRDSAFFRLRTKAKLADVLQISQSKMKRLTKLGSGLIDVHSQ